MKEWISNIANGDGETVSVTVGPPPDPTPTDQDYEMVPVDGIQPHPDNARRGNLPLIRESIRANGFVGACVVQRSTGNIIVGNHRYLAAVEEGMTEIPVVWVDKSDAEARRLLLADNRTADIASYDDASLVELLTAVAREDLFGSGFTAEDLELLMMTSDVDASLADLEVEYPLNDEAERGLWRRIPVSLPPGLYEQWTSWWAGLPGEDDIEKARNLIER